MSKVQVGDRVCYSSNNGSSGYGAVLDTGDGQVKVQTDSGDRVYVSARHTVKVGKVHPHRDVIIAYANGAEIQTASYQEEDWKTAKSPAFHQATRYRVKPFSPQREKEITSIRKEMESLSERLKQLESE